MAAFARIGFCLLMSKTFRPWTIDQPLLLPPSVQDFVGEDHLARFILALVLEPLDLGEIEAAYASERGQPPFDPAMMTALLLYGYCNGVYSSRRIAKGARERVDFLSIVGLDPPDFRTVSDFRKRHLKALSGLFGQVLKLCEQAGLVKLGHVALDGTKIKANASKHKAMSYERMEKRAAELEAEVERWLSAAEAADAEEDRAFGRDKSGEELPKWVADKKKRVEKIRAAKAELEAEAKAARRVCACSEGLRVAKMIDLSPKVIAPVEDHLRELLAADFDAAWASFPYRECSQCPLPADADMRRRGSHARISGDKPWFPFLIRSRRRYNSTIARTGPRRSNRLSSHRRNETGDTPGKGCRPIQPKLFQTNG